MTGASGGGRDTTLLLLRIGAAAGPVYVALAAAQILTRDGFDMRIHALSLLANGPWGWVQVLNFVLTGLLVICGAIGLRRTYAEGGGGLWAPLLLGFYGVGMIASGIFVADPGAGFPPGTPEVVDGMSRGGLLHFVFGGIAFAALIAAAFVFAVRFRGAGNARMAAWSALTGGVVLLAFGAVASGSASPRAIIGLYLAVGLAWLWHMIVHVREAGRRCGRWRWG